jgi:hypothetical protein
MIRKSKFALPFILLAFCSACWAGTRPLKEDTPVTIIVGPFLDSAGAAQTSLTVANIDCNLYKNNGTKVDVTLAASGTSNDCVHVEDGYYSLELTATDTSTPGYLRISFQISGAVNFHEDFEVQPLNIYESWYSTDKLQVDVTQYGNSNGTFSGGRPEVNASHISGNATPADRLEEYFANRIRVATISAHTAGTAVIEAGVNGLDELVGSVVVIVDTGDLSQIYVRSIVSQFEQTLTLNASIANSQAGETAWIFPASPILQSAANRVLTAVPNAAASASGGLFIAGTNAQTTVTSGFGAGTIARATFAAETGLQSIRSGTAQAGSATSITLDASASSVTDFYKHNYVYVTSNAGAGQYRLITGYNGTSKAATIAPAWITGQEPANGSTFAILPAGIANVEAWMGKPVAIPTVDGVPEVDVTHVGGEPVCD